MIIIILIVLLITIGCNQSDKNSSINDFSISYLEIMDDMYLVENEVSISSEVPNANRVLLNIQDYGQNEIEETIEGEKSGDDWFVEYKNNDPFTKEIWLVAYFDDGEQISEKKVITNQDQSYESVFENIIPNTLNESEKINLYKQKVNLTILGWVDNNNVLAKDKDNLFSYDIYNNEKNIIYENIWNIYTSFSKDKFIYENDDGVFISNINKEENKKIFDINASMILKDLTWSRNEDSIILNIVEDKEEKYYLIDLNNNDIELIDIDKDLYSLEKMLYLDNNYIYAIGNIKSKDNEDNGDLSNYLLSYNINTKRVKNYTPDIQPMDDIKILSQVNDREFLIRMSTKIISEEEITSSDIIYILDTKGRTLKKIKEDMDFPYLYSLSSNKEEYIYLSNIMENDKVKMNEKAIILGLDKEEEIEILKAVQYYPSNFYWSNNGKKIAFYIDNIKEIYLIERKS
jgi:hypothetical protein